jgi:hypothetical protein
MPALLASMPTHHDKLKSVWTGGCVEVVRSTRCGRGVRLPDQSDHALTSVSGCSHCEGSHLWGECVQALRGLGFAVSKKEARSLLRQVDCKVESGYCTLAQFIEIIEMLSTYSYTVVREPGLWHVLTKSVKVRRLVDGLTCCCVLLRLAHQLQIECGGCPCFATSMC